MLREEILKSSEAVKTYRTLLYTIVVAILAFAFDKNNPWLFLLPFAAILPLYLLAMHQVDSTLRIGA
jgi:1,4-dihydroxy-2-naphthoate octaprenyltransferase